MFFTARSLESERRRRIALGGFLLLVVLATVGSFALAGRLESPGTPVANVLETGRAALSSDGHTAALPNPFAVVMAVLENATLHVLNTLITKVLSGCWWPYGLIMDGSSLSLGRSPGCSGSDATAAVRRARPAVHRLAGAESGTSVVSSVE
jgi:hypothetical protein